MTRYCFKRNYFLCILLPIHTHTHTHTPTQVNTKYESVDPINEQLKTNTVGIERNFDNTLYDTGKADHDYSSPWDSRVDGSTEPMVVSSTNSSHAVVMRVNSNEHSSTHRVEYATIDPNPKWRRSSENTKLTSLSSEPPTESQPVYNTSELPPTEYAELAQRPSTAGDGRSFDNTGEDGLYRSSSPILSRGKRL